MPAKPLIVYRAKFKTLRVATGAGVQRLACELEMELRPAPGGVDLYTVHWAANGRLLTARKYTLNMAKRRAEAIFCERLTEWQPIEVENAAAPASTSPAQRGRGLDQ